jgi:hypothetical protein
MSSSQMLLCLVKCRIKRVDRSGGAGFAAHQREAAPLLRLNRPAFEPKGLALLLDIGNTRFSNRQGFDHELISTRNLPSRRGQYPFAQCLLDNPPSLSALGRLQDWGETELQVEVDGAVAGGLRGEERR